ncbi:Asp-tRNA(Asn)/Glu-tRNA(Gln) amidotransferase subunit GatA [Candidatus Collierbacteria bacterium]|nr:Asp-tRNA(Asn)/Glu-tRNA(Gln) amidotransferase subunit GatA [Candidatus Collierbacteria bacterium]
MGSSITKQQVQHVAKLANLQLSEEELELYTKQIKDIVGYVEQLDKVKVDGVKPTYQTLDGMVNVWREDEVGMSLSQNEALSQAKRIVDGYFVAAPALRLPLPLIKSGRRGVASAEFGRTSEFFQSKNSGLSENKYNAILTEVDEKGAVGHKDLFLTKGVRSSAGSNVLREYLPQYSSTVVELLEKAGFKTKYKLNCDAWAHGSSGENSDFGSTKNPWNEEFTPGGSSSGSAAAVAAGLVDVATGTDTGGSIRLPASFCNLVGLKSTYGALSRYGIVAMASSLDSPGVIGKSVREVKKVFKVMAGKDERDATSLDSVKRPGLVLTRPGIIRIGIPKEYFDKGIDLEVRQAVMTAVKILEKNGFKIQEISLPNSKYGIAVYYLVQTTEVSSNLGRYDGIRYGFGRESFGAEAKRRIMLGTFASSAGYSAKFFEKAAKVRTLIIQDFEKAFNSSADGVDVILGPVSSTPPFKLGEKANDPLTMYLSDILTVSVNLAGLPALALPCGFSKHNLPIGMQLIGPRWSENLLFDVGEVYQSLTKWHTKKPQV